MKILLRPASRHVRSASLCRAVIIGFPVKCIDKKNKKESLNFILINVVCSSSFLRNFAL